MNKKWQGRKSHLDTNSLQVEWLGAEDAKQEIRGSSASGREAREKSRDLWLATRDHVAVWGASPSIKKIPIFLMNFLAFLETISLSVYKNRQWCQTPITASMPLSVQKPALKGVFWTDSNVKICGSAPSPHSPSSTAGPLPSPPTSRRRLEGVRIHHFQ